MTEIFPYLDEEELTIPLIKVLLVNTSNTNPFLGFDIRAPALHFSICSEAFSSFLEGMLSSFVATCHICEELGLLAGY